MLGKVPRIVVAAAAKREESARNRSAFARNRVIPCEEGGRRLAGRLVFYGAGGMGREMVHAARLDPRPKAFLADGPLEPYPGLEATSFEALTGEDEICVAVGDPALRRRLAGKIPGT